MKFILSLSLFSVRRKTNGLHANEVLLPTAPCAGPVLQGTVHSCFIITLSFCIYCLCTKNYLSGWVCESHPKLLLSTSINSF